ncbi:lachesin [Parasteatoda tepidariorum]|uniref:lachesin n=1 Tax=Parasteatoda tepidariorum TaxID=114398 RepID=UPI00077FBD07|nr:lachesin-like [Parasteatoda tepidariorum]
MNSKKKKVKTCLFRFLLIFTIPVKVKSHEDLEPEFTESIPNVTVATGQEAILSCAVDNLGSYRVAWLRLETQSLLTIQKHLVVKNSRLVVNNPDYRHWNLHINDVQEGDRGGYMCQVNTVPMKGLVGFLDVVVPPSFVDSETSSEVLAREGTNVTLSCRVRGHPPPTTTWRREDGQILMSNICSYRMEGRCENDILYEGSDMPIVKVSRLNMGTYLCIANNGIPPTAVRKAVLHVHFPPMISIPNQLIGASIGEDATLDCNTEAYPMSINYWTKENSVMIVSNSKYITSIQDNTYKVHMKLTIVSVRQGDYGIYKCSARNSLGTTDGTIRLYQIHDSKHFINTPTTPETEVVKGKGPPMQDDSLTKELNGDVEPPIQRPSVSEGASSSTKLLSNKQIFMHQGLVICLHLLWSFRFK